MKELIEIQAELKVPKNQRNTFGNYNYRSAEDITEAAKPVIRKHGCELTMSDDILLIGNRYFLRATSTLTNSAGEKVTTTGIAELADSKKGMDPAQLTGATSSYARKYALGGLFALDDIKDPDATNTHAKDEPRNAQQRPQQTPEQKQLAFAEKLGVKKSDMETAIGKDFTDFSADDNRFLREVFGMMIRDKLDFETACQRQSEIESEAKA